MHACVWCAQVVDDIKQLPLSGASVEIHRASALGWAGTGPMATKSALPTQQSLQLGTTPPPSPSRGGGVAGGYM
eukprot:COSAG05_NODE_373_length_10684_cov_22.075012_9_plen_74_part_00